MSDRTTSTASRENRARDDLTTLLAVAETRRVQFQELLPSEIPWDVFKDTFKIAIQRNPRLLEADRQSLWIALQKAAMDGLKPDGREGALVIFGDDSEDEDGKRVATNANKPKQVQWMPMVAGLIKLVRNTGEVTGIRAKLVYKGERVEITDEDGVESYKHVRVIAADSEISDDPANIVGGYAVVNYKDGSWEMEPMSRTQIDRVRAVSRAKKGPWLPWYDEMAKKTILRRLIKRLDKSSIRRVEAALDRDETLSVDAVATIVPPDQRRIAGPEKASAGRAASFVDHPDPENINPIAGADTPPVGAGDRRDARSDERDAAALSPGKDQPVQGAQQPRESAGATRTDQRKAEPEAWFPTDDIGEPVEIPGGAEAFTSATEFAGWLCTAMDLTTRPDALWENNLDATEELKAKWPDLFAEVYARYGSADRRITAAQAAALTAQQRAQAQPAASEPEADAGGDAAGDGIPPLKVPLTAAGKVSWPQYATTARKELDALSTQTDVSAWVNRNFPTYHGKAIAAAIDKHIRERRAAIDADKRVVHQTVDAPPQTAAVDPDERRCQDYLDEIAGIASLDAARLFSERGDVVAVMKRFDLDKPDLSNRLKAAAAARWAELKGGAS